MVCCRDKNKVADELSNQAVDTSGWQGLKDMQVVMRTIDLHAAVQYICRLVR